MTLACAGGNGDDVAGTLGRHLTRPHVVEKPVWITMEIRYNMSGEPTISDLWAPLTLVGYFTGMQDANVAALA